MDDQAVDSASDVTVELGQGVEDGIDGDPGTTP